MNRSSLGRRKFLQAAGLGLVGSMLPLESVALGGTGSRTVVRPEDTQEALRNPAMGWTFHYYSNIPSNYGSRLEPSDTLPEWPGLTVIYLRVPWAFLEPEEGEFDWSLVDTPAQRWIDKGVRVAFRFSCSESWMRYATPEWVKDAGAKGYNFKPGEGVTEDGPFWEPDYADPVFLEKLDHFLAAAAARYDADPNVDFIDVGSYGVWGEGHTGASSRKNWPVEVRKKHLDLHVKHFKETLLAANDDLGGHAATGDHNPIIDYARELGMTLRDDSILVQGGERAYFHEDLAQDFWPHVPVVLECQHYGPSKQQGKWKDGSLYLQALEEYHAAYAGIHWWPREFLNANRELIHRMNMRLGYRLQLTEASWPEKVGLGEPFSFSAKWRNAGVTPCYPGGHPALTLKDKKGGIVGVFVDEEFDVRDLPVGKPGGAPAREEKKAITPGLPPAARLGKSLVKPGTYDLFISVGTRQGTPKIALPLPDGDGHRRYRLGKLKVAER